MYSSGKQKKLFFKPEQTLSIGCLNCAEFDACGGNQSAPGLFDCSIFCQCEDKSTCTNVCINSDNFVARVQEIKGFKLDNIPRSAPLFYPELPLVAPVIYHKSRRRETLNVEAVTLPLRLLTKGKTGEIKFHSKKQVAEHFKFRESAKLIISGTDDDPYIENYWSHRVTKRLPEMLAKLQPDLVTVPNYSLPLDVVRTDNLYNTKRIAIAWHELVSQGIPAALHVNARTDKDWLRWIEFIKERDEIHSICFEFATGGLADERSRYYVENLTKLVSSVGRDLRLILRGGVGSGKRFHSDFSSLVFLDSSAFMKTVYRRQLNWQPGDKVTERVIRTEVSAPLDFLLNRNIKTMSDMIKFNTLYTKEMQTPMNKSRAA